MTLISIEKAILLNASTGFSLGSELLHGEAALESGENGPRTFILEGGQLHALRLLVHEGDSQVTPAIEALKASADELLQQEPPSVVHKTSLPPSGNAHDYYSAAPYWWPNEEGKDSSPYVRRDGEVNPAIFSADYDAERLREFSDSIVTLSLTGFLTEDDRYSKKALEWLKIWFLEPETSQEPHFEYAQLIPGHIESRGSGLVEARQLVYVIEAIQLLEFDGLLTKMDYQRLKRWFSKLLEWMRTSQAGIVASKARNNIAFWYDLQCLAYASFVEKSSVVQQILEASRIGQLSEQLDIDGGLPEELARTRPLDYVAFTLLAMALLSRIGSQHGQELWDNSDQFGRSFQAAQDWLASSSQSAGMRLNVWSILESSVLANLPPPSRSSKSTKSKKPSLLERRIDDLIIQSGILARLADARREMASNRAISLEQTQSELTQTQEELTRIQADLKDREGEIEQLRTQASARDQDVETLERQANDRLKETAVLQRQLAEVQETARKDRERLSTEAKRLKATVETMRRSRSWRITRPLRAPRELVRRLEDQRVAPFPQILRAVRKARNLIHESKPQRSQSAVTLRARKHRPAPQPDIAALKQEYESKGLSLETDSFVLYRILGNDLPPRHITDQTLENVRFILENEPELESCEKRWVLNRIFDEDKERALRELLESKGQEYLRIPFDLDEYAQVGWDLDSFPPGFSQSPEFKKLDPEQQDRARIHAYRHKNNYVMHNNGARNAALEDGRGRAKWILPWDGNCFMSAEAWQELKAAVTSAPYLKYFIVPMARITSNDELLRLGARPEAVEEPQILFRRDAAESFDEAYPYGRRPKVELFWRLGIPGPWSTWRSDSWDLPFPVMVPEAGQFGTAGWVARLSSGVANLEEYRRTSIRDRGEARGNAILLTLQRLDEMVVERKLHSIDTMTYDQGMLDNLQSTGPDYEELLRVRAHLLEEAQAALTRGPYSVTDKTTLPPSQDRRDYWHPAPYWWPNPNTPDGLPYVRRDGARAPGTRLYEPESEKFDRTRLQRFFDDTTTLSLAARVTGEGRYAEHAARLVRAWFIDPQTRMNPHLRYAQVRFGHDGNEGQGTGIIEMKDLYYFLDAVRLLEADDALSDSNIQALRQWLATYLGWLLKSPQGRAEVAMPNNHGTAYDLQVASLAAYLGDAALLTATLERSATRIGQHFDPDGRQPNEMDRTATAHYHCFNAQTWINLSRLAERCGIDLWGIRLKDGRGLKRGLEWLLRELGREEWQFEQIEEFNRNRSVPILAAYLQVYGDSDNALDLSSLRGHYDSVSFFPHDGVPPYWRLCLPRIEAAAKTNKHLKLPKAKSLRNA